MIYGGFILGLIGSLHCAAMCGPLMLGLSKHNYSLPSLIIHHIGRWIGYIILAVLFRTLVSPLYIFQIQQYIGIISGILLMLFALKKYIPFINRFLEGFTSILATKMSQQKTGRQGNIVLGILNGLLPCGLSFGTAILSVNMDTYVHSALFMVFFGIGTLPMLISISYFPKIKWLKTISSNWSLTSNKLIFIMGFLILIRSAELGIPYVSPAYNSTTGEAECCESQP